MRIGRPSVVAAVACLCLTGLSACGESPQPSPTVSDGTAPTGTPTAATSASTATPGSTPSASAADTGSNTSFADGTRTVGKDLEAGKYQPTTVVSGTCTLTVVNNEGDINIDGNYGKDAEVDVDTPRPGTVVYTVTDGRPVIPLRSGDTVTSKNCGTWQRA